MLCIILGMAFVLGLAGAGFVILGALWCLLKLIRIILILMLYGLGWLIMPERTWKELHE